MKQLEQIKQLIGAYADNLAAQERVLRQLQRLIDRETDKELPPKVINSSAICIHRGDEEYFIPLTEKDSTGKQLGVICNNSWGLMPNTSTCLVSYPSDSIESITREIHKK